MKIMNNGKLPYYSNANLSDLMKEASPDLHKLKNKIINLSKQDFYEIKPNIYIYGDHRRGKTWIMHAIMNHIINTYNEKSIYYVTVPTLLEYIKISNDTNIFDEESIFAIFLNARVLFVDDFGLEYKSATGWSITKFESFLRTRFAYNKITFLSGTIDLDSIEKIYGKSLADFIDGEFITYEIYPDSKDLSKIALSKRWKK